MKVKLTAGAELDMLTAKEVKELLRDWHLEQIRGARPVLFDAQGTIANNAISIGGDSGSASSGRLGPEAGFVWSIRRVGQTGLTVASDPTSLFIGNPNAKQLVFPAFTGNAAAMGYRGFNSGELILMPNQRLLLASTGNVAATGVVTLTGAAWELPIGLLWQLM